MWSWSSCRGQKGCNTNTPGGCVQRERLRLGSFDKDHLLGEGQVCQNPEKGTQDEFHEVCSLAQSGPADPQSQQEMISSLDQKPIWLPFWPRPCLTTISTAESICDKMVPLNSGFLEEQDAHSPSSALCIPSQRNGPSKTAPWRIKIDPHLPGFNLQNGTQLPDSLCSWPDYSLFISVFSRKLFIKDKSTCLL